MKDQNHFFLSRVYEKLSFPQSIFFLNIIQIDLQSDILNKTANQKQTALPNCSKEESIRHVIAPSISFGFDFYSDLNNDEACLYAR